MKKEFKLNYGSKLQVALGMDIEIFKYKSIFECYDKIDDIVNDTDQKTIYLFTYDHPSDDNYDIIITRNINPILDFINKHRRESTAPATLDYNFFLQEYKTWQDAYDVALMMREGSLFCYSEK